MKVFACIGRICASVGIGGVASRGATRKSSIDVLYLFLGGVYRCLSCSQAFERLPDKEELLQHDTRDMGDAGSKMRLACDETPLLQTVQCLAQGASADTVTFRHERFADMRTWGQFAIDDGFGDLVQDPFSEGFADFFAFVLILRRHRVDTYDPCRRNIPILGSIWKYMLTVLSMAGIPTRNGSLFK